MIILSCGHCGNKNLGMTAIYYEAYCADCGKKISLWEMKPVCISDTLPLQQVNVSEVTTHVLT